MRRSKFFKKVLIISTENDDEFMLNHQVEAKEAHDFIHLINTKIITKFDEEDRVYQKIRKIIDRLDYQLETHKYKAVIIDPMPKFIDWNKEPQVAELIERLNELAKNMNVVSSVFGMTVKMRHTSKYTEQKARRLLRTQSG